MVVARYVRLSIFILSLFFSYTCPFVYTLQYLENPQTKTFVLLLGDCHRHGDIDAKHGQLLIKFLANLSGAPFKTLMIKESEDENTFVMPTQCFKSEGVSNDENADQASAQQPVQEEKPSFISVGHFSEGSFMAISILFIALIASIFSQDGQIKEKLFKTVSS